jgi:DNA invertase Pin-like site-specific DNA recombinase
MLGAIAQFETEIRAERQMDGIQKAKEKGVKFGRKKKLPKKQRDELRKRRQQRRADQGFDGRLWTIEGVSISLPVGPATLSI